MKRDFNSPEYKQWRKSVFARDKYKCKVCGSRKRIQAHHIKKWYSHPLLRFVISNGITLCKKHHDEVWGKEESYENLFMSLIEEDFGNFFRLRQIRYGSE